MADITEQTPVSDSDTKIQYYADYYKLNRNHKPRKKGRN